MNEPNTSHTDKALRGLRHLGLAQLLTQAITWGLTAVTVHILTPRDYGLIATAGMFTVFAQMLFDGGLTEVLVSQRNFPARLQGAALSAIILVSLLLGSMVFAVAPVAASFFHSPPLTGILEVSSLYLPLTALGFAPGVLLNKQMQFKSLGRIQLIAGVCQGVCTLALAYVGKAYWALIIGSFLGMAIRVTLLWIALDQKPTPNLSLRDLRPVLRSGAHMIGQRLSYFTLDNLDVFILSRLCGPIELGPYSVARNLAHTALNKISGVTGQIAVPTFAAKTEAPDQLRGLVTIMSVTATATFPLFWIMAVAAQLALPLIFGNRWLHVVFPFSAFAVILPLRTMYSFLNSSLVGTGRTAISFRNTLTWLTLLIPFVLIGVTKGADGVAFGWAAAFPLVFYFAMRRTSRIYLVKTSTFLKPLLFPVICAGISMLLAELILIGLERHLSAPLILAFQCAAASSCYVLLLRRLSPVQYDQTLSLVRRIARV